MGRRLLAAVWVLTCATGVAFAHQSSVKYTDVTVDGARAHVRLTVAPADVTEPLGLPTDARPSLAEASVPVAAAYVATWVTLALPSGAACTAGAPTSGPDPDGRFLVVAWDATCPADIRELVLDFTPFFAVDVSHEAIVSVHAANQDVEPRVVRSAHPRLTVRPGAGGSLLDWIRHGMDHIYGGPDHIAFVLALLLVVVLERTPLPGAGWRVRTPLRALRSTAAIITAFTIAHSLSLIAASLGWVRLPSQLVESLIALSIVYTAIENVVRPDVRWRFALTFGFGLIHGLGFASVLEALLPREAVIPPLLAFNVGVELGQLTIVLVAIPVFWGIARLVGPERYRRVALTVAASPLVLVGMKWLIERVFDVRTFSILGM